MTKTTHICDRCGKEINGIPVAVETVRYKTVKAPGLSDKWKVEDRTWHIPHKDRYDLCRACSKELRAFLHGKQ